MTIPKCPYCGQEMTEMGYIPFTDPPVQNSSSPIFYICTSCDTSKDEISCTDHSTQLKSF